MATFPLCSGSLWPAFFPPVGDGSCPARPAPLAPTPSLLAATLRRHLLLPFVAQPLLAVRFSPRCCPSSLASVEAGLQPGTVLTVLAGLPLMLTFSYLPCPERNSSSRAAAACWSLSHIRVRSSLTS